MNPHATETDTQRNVRILSASIKWLWLGWLLAAALAVLALFQTVSLARARNEVTLANTEADVAKTQAEAYRQQLEAERILTTHEIETLRKTQQTPAIAP